MINHQSKYINKRAAARMLWQPFVYLSVLMLMSWQSVFIKKESVTVISDTAINLSSPNHILLQRLVIEKMNVLRSGLKLTHLKWDDTLSWSSKDHLKNMIAKKFFDHQDPNNVKSPNLKQRVEVYSDAYGCLSENLLETFPFEFSGKTINYVTKKRNIGYVYLDPLTKKPIRVLTYNQLAQEIVDRWIKSGVHYKNLVNSKYTYIGIAINFPKYYETAEINACTVVANFGGCK
jgi:uncharacterized protein YkwD